MSTPTNKVPLLDQPYICDGPRNRRAPVHFYSHQYQNALNPPIPVTLSVPVAQSVHYAYVAPSRTFTLNLMDYYLLAPLPERDFPYDNLAYGSGYNIGWEPVNRS
jgi:hypothetical protein